MNRTQCAGDTTRVIPIVSGYVVVRQMPAVHIRQKSVIALERLPRKRRARSKSKPATPFCRVSFSPSRVTCSNDGSRITRIRAALYAGGKPSVSTIALLPCTSVIALRLAVSPASARARNDGPRGPMPLKGPRGKSSQRVWTAPPSDLSGIRH